MGKLVLAIIAVTFVQLAFSVLVAKDGTDYAVVGQIAERFEEKDSDTARLEEIPQAIIPATAGAPVVVAPVRTSVGRASASGRSVIYPRSRAEARGQFNQNNARIRRAYIASLDKTPNERIVVPKRSGASIPRGYTMVLVDYTPATSTGQAKGISKPRKRPYLARVLPALANKPWNWIKSVASKLD